MFSSLLSLLAALHTPTLQIVAVVVMALTVIASLVLWGMAPAERYTRYWAGGYVGICMGLALGTQRGYLSDFIALVASNGAIAVGAALLVSGTAHYCGRPRLAWPVTALAAVVAALIALLVYVQPWFELRVIIMSSLMMAACGQMAWMLWRHTYPGAATLQRALALLLLVQMAFYAVGATGNLVPQAARGYLDTPGALNGIYLNGIVALLVVLFAFSGLTHRRLHLHLRHAANHDPLTDTLNRRAMDAVIDSHVAAQQAGEPLSLILLDLDHFKQLNDHYGHQIGDLALIAFAEQVRAGLRQQDQLGRIGGEEFCVVLPGADATTAAAIAERLRSRVMAIRLPEAESLRLTVSAGVATAPPLQADAATLLKAADVALYQAKREGRNRVVSA